MGARRSDPGEVTRVLTAISSGEEGASSLLYALVYDELRWIARGRMAGQMNQTLQPTALVHEAFLRLLKGGAPSWENRAHFFGAAAEAMRQILIERARARTRMKRGGGGERIELSEELLIEEQRAGELLDLDRALDQLDEVEPELARVVKLRYFAGLTVDELADVLRVSPRSINRMWFTARAWLQERMSDGRG